MAATLLSDGYFAGWIDPAATVAANDDPNTHLVLGAEATHYFFPNTTPGHTYALRIRARNSIGGASEWVTVYAVAENKDAPPGTPSGLYTESADTGVNLFWQNPPDRDLRYIEIWEAATNYRSGARLVAQAVGTMHHRPAVKANRYYWIRAVDSVGNQSGWHPAGMQAGIAGSASGIDSDLLNNKAVIHEALADAAVQARNLARNIIDEVHLAGGLNVPRIVSALPTSGNFDGRLVVLLSDRKLYRYDAEAGAFTRKVDGADLLVDSVTAAAIQAGAVGVDELAFNLAIGSKLAAGQINSNHLLVGVGGNYFQNSDVTQGLDWWTYWRYHAGIVLSEFMVNYDPNWEPQGCHTVRVWETSYNLPESACTDIQLLNPQGGAYFPVEPGRTYEFSAYTGAHRCKIAAMIAWIDTNGTWITDVYPQTAEGFNDYEKVGFRSLSDYKRIVVRGQAPANAVRALGFCRKYTTKPGGTDSYAFVTKYQFCETFPFATEAVPWGPGGVTRIGPGSVVTQNLITYSAQIANLILTTGHFQDLSVTAAKMGLAQITNAHINWLWVDTLWLAGNAVTIPISAWWGDIVLGPNGSTTRQLVYNATGAPVHIIVSANRISSANTSGRREMFIWVNSSNGGQSGAAYNVMYNGHDIAGTVLTHWNSAFPAGPVTLTVTFATVGGTANNTFYDTQLFLIETKR